MLAQRGASAPSFVRTWPRRDARRCVEAPRQCRIAWRTVRRGDASKSTARRRRASAPDRAPALRRRAREPVPRRPRRRGAAVGAELGQQMRAASQPRPDAVRSARCASKRGARSSLSGCGRAVRASCVCERRWARLDAPAGPGRGRPGLLRRVERRLTQVDALRNSGSRPPPGPGGRSGSRPSRPDRVTCSRTAACRDETREPCRAGLIGRAARSQDRAAEPRRVRCRRRPVRASSGTACGVPGAGAPS